VFCKTVWKWVEGRNRGRTHASLHHVVKPPHVLCHCLHCIPSTLHTRVGTHEDASGLKAKICIHM